MISLVCPSKPRNSCRISTTAPPKLSRIVKTSTWHHESFRFYKFSPCQVRRCEGKGRPTAGRQTGGQLLQRQEIQNKRQGLCLMRGWSAAPSAAATKGLTQLFLFFFFLFPPQKYQPGRVNRIRCLQKSAPQSIKVDTRTDWPCCSRPSGAMLPRQSIAA